MLSVNLESRTPNSGVKCPISSVLTKNVRTVHIGLKIRAPVLDGFQSSANPESRIKGFTLIELLFVISLLAVVSLAVFGTFNNGIKIWQKVNAPALEEDVGVFMSKFTADVRNAFEFTGVDFLGDDESFEFATLVQSHRMKNRTVGKVAYYFDSGEDAVIREKKDYSHLSNDNDGIEEVMLEGVKSMECLYYYFDKEIKRHLWVEEWDQKDKEEIPIAIKIKLEFKDESARKISRTVSMFSGG